MEKLKCKVLKEFNGHAKGATIELKKHNADELASLGYVEIVKK